MDQKYYGRIVGKNLKRLAYEHNKTQSDIAKDLKISKSTVSSWMNATKKSPQRSCCHARGCRGEK